MRTHRPTVVGAALALTIVLLTAACGADNEEDGSATGAARTLDIEMADLAFEPTELTVAKGDEVTFRFTNTGKVAHDAFIGDKDAQAEHASEMTKDTGGMHHDDDDEEGITVKPGDEGELTYTFDDAGRLEIGCHQPGHYAAGMKIEVRVEA